MQGAYKVIADLNRVVSRRGHPWLGHRRIDRGAMSRWRFSYHRDLRLHLVGVAHPLLTSGIAMMLSPHLQPVRLERHDAALVARLGTARPTKHPQAPSAFFPALAMTFPDRLVQRHVLRDHRDPRLPDRSIRQLVPSAGVLDGLRIRWGRMASVPFATS